MANAMPLLPVVESAGARTHTWSYLPRIRSGKSGTRSSSTSRTFHFSETREGPRFSNLGKNLLVLSVATYHGFDIDPQCASCALFPASCRPNEWCFVDDASSRAGYKRSRHLSAAFSRQCCCLSFSHLFEFVNKDYFSPIHFKDLPASDPGHIAPLQGLRPHWHRGSSNKAN